MNMLKVKQNDWYFADTILHAFYRIIFSYHGSNFTDISLGIAWDNVYVSNRLQAIIWTNDELVY